MADKPRFQILSFSDAYPSKALDALFFTVETTAGSMELACPAVDLGSIMQFFAGCAIELGGGITGGLPQNDLIPIPADRLGFTTGSTPDTKTLVLQFGQFALAFEMDHATLGHSASELAQVLQALSAPGRPN
ncbi:hypothetical protein [Sphingomonas sp.]|uniref:hypothetical protein n=1 Tax=Sphingomonas sp. TaxID=28214 RepID=UPI003BA9272E